MKLTLLKGAALCDPACHFNASLAGNARRAIDIHEGEEVDGIVFKTLTLEAVALNTASKPKPAEKAKSLIRLPSYANLGRISRRMHPAWTNRP